MENIYKNIIKKCTTNGVEVKDYYSISDAAVDNKLDPCTISSSLNGWAKTAGGYCWKLEKVIEFEKLLDNNYSHFNDKYKWKCHQDYPNYLFSNKGDVYSVKKGRIIANEVITIRNGERIYKYYTCRLKNNLGKRILVSISRLVAELFVENFNPEYIVHHTDNDTLNNNVINLHNINRKTHYELTEKNGGFYDYRIHQSEKTGTPIYAYDFNGNFVCGYPSIRKATKLLGYSSKTSITIVLDNEDKTAFGYMWRTEKKLKIKPFKRIKDRYGRKEILIFNSEGECFLSIKSKKLTAKELNMGSYKLDKHLTNGDYFISNLMQDLVKVVYREEYLNSYNI